MTETTIVLRRYIPHGLEPWLREVDLWKSFINVDVEFLQKLDDFFLNYYFGLD